ncbi:ABC transporter permease [Pseudalkalibacillus berkeleyi]|uniref:ABC transporter permease subunit n=1 Tax=Pseudalkalibacillus berkeleyi TaxID=1069813 RepID=A0ABS9H6W8_9BACL|nr:ABC transporter permease subunit [Pseudalkalibacillus berkeleyi]MCF6139623.1 ABC transporter permease subunit [Pseudalkalibacillus berkeleyi]
MRLFKNTYFLIGFLFLFTLIATSFLHTFVWDNHVAQTQVLYEKGRAIEAAPLSPSLDIPLGTNNLGFHFTHMISIGAKYTIGFAIIIATIRLLTSLVFGILYGAYLYRFRRYITWFVDVFNYVPVTLLALFILTPFLVENFNGFAYTFWERVGIEVVILAFLAVPTTSILIGNELGRIYNHEFIDGAKVVGGSRLHILWKHVRPHIQPQLWIIFMQQLVQTMLVLAHLGFFKVFFGGTNISFDPNWPDPPQSMSYEWSGLIGNGVRYITVYPWIVLVPIVFFALTILSMNFMLEGMKSVTENWRVKFSTDESSAPNYSKNPSPEKQFTPLKNHTNQRRELRLNHKE